MAGSINKVILVGNLGKDPEIVHFDNGGAVVKFPLATSESYTNREGIKVTNTEWHNVVINSRGLVDVAHKYLKKGHKVYLEGKIRTRKWQDSNGGDRYTTEILVREMTMLTSRAESESSASANSYSNTAPAPASVGGGVHSPQQSYAAQSGSAPSSYQSNPQTMGGHTDDQDDDDLPF